MKNEKNKPYWLSINLDDTISEPADSFEDACCNKSLYIAEQTYFYESVSGKTTYYKYRFFDTDGVRAFPLIGDCEVLSDVTQSYCHFQELSEFVKNSPNDFVYPVTRYGARGTLNKGIICDNEGKQKVVYLNHLSEILPLLRNLSRVGCWEEFLFLEYLNVYDNAIDSLKNSITKYGYSKKEYSLEYGIIRDTKYRDNSFRKEFEQIETALNELLDRTDSIYKSKKSYTIKTIEENLKFIGKALDGEKPWRKFILS